MCNFVKKKESMQNKKIEINYSVYLSSEELSDEDKKLVLQARKISLKAYAPYSQFRVGAAVLLSSKKVILANNQENVSYPEGMCAERIALFYASANYSNKKIKTIAIAGNSELQITDNPITPCGACRQTIAEYEIKQKEKIKVIMTGISGKVIVIEGIENLLPFCFKMK